MASVGDKVKIGGSKGLPRALAGLVDRIDEEIADAGLASYALLKRGGDDQTTFINAGDHLEFTGLEGAAVGVSVSNVGNQNQGTGLIELESAGTWLMICWLDGVFSGAGGQARYRWRDNTGAADLGFSGRVTPASSVLNTYGVNAAVAIETFTTPVQVEVRIVSETLLTLLAESVDDGMRAVILKLASE